MTTNFCVLDLETSCDKGPHGPAAKDPNNDFFTVIIANSPENVTVIHEPVGFRRKLPAKAAEIIRTADVIIGHNLTFDLSYVWETEEIQNFLLRGGQIWDTQYVEYLLTGQRHTFASLGELQLKYLGTKLKKDRISKIYSRGTGADKILAASKRCKRVYALYNQYCHDDGKTPFLIFKEQYKMAQVYSMLPIIKMYNKYLLALINVSNTGITVDLENTEKTLRELKIKSIHYLQEAVEIIKPMWDERIGEFNINSPKDKSAVLFGGVYTIKERVQEGYYKNGNEKWVNKPKDIVIKGFGVPTFLSEEGKTKGQYATGGDVLQKIHDKSKNPTLKKYCELQKLAMNYGKMCSTYLEPFLKLSVNGKLYPKYNTCLTVTSRLSSSEPNLQNIPSKGEMLNYIQGQLTAPPGWACVSIDYSQLEIWVLAFLSKDPNLVKDLMNGVDFHIKRLSYATKRSYEELYELCKVQKLPEWDYKRSQAKTVSYQKAYGAGIKKLAQRTGLTEAEIQEIFTKEDQEYFVVKLFNEHVREKVQMSKEVGRAVDLPANAKKESKNGRRFEYDQELLPIIQENGDFRFEKNLYRHVGYYQTRTGKRYSFEEFGQERFGKLRIDFSPTQMKNYQVQGTASDIQASSTAALFPYLLQNKDKVRMVNEIHDSKWFIVKYEHIDDVVLVLKEKMESIKQHFNNFLNVEIPFNIPVDIKIGPNFAVMETYKEEIMGAYYGKKHNHTR